MIISDIIADLKTFAPLELAEDWDNVGLLLGDSSQAVASVMTCLTLTPDVAAEAVRENVDLIVSHHPILFRPIQRLTTETSEGRMLLQLAQANVSVYSPHTAFDSAKTGINDFLARRMELQHASPIRPAENKAELNSELIGAGRFGSRPTAVSLASFLDEVKLKFGLSVLQYVGDENAMVQKVAVACGSAAEFLNDAASLGCDTFVTGEARFHACLEARQLGVNMILLGHFISERPAIEFLAAHIKDVFGELVVFPSKSETDPLRSC